MGVAVTCGAGGGGGGGGGCTDVAVTLLPRMPSLKAATPKLFPLKLELGLSVVYWLNAGTVWTTGIVWVRGTVAGKGITWGKGTIEGIGITDGKGTTGGTSY